MRRLARLTVLVLVITLALVSALERPASARARHRRHKMPILQIGDTAALSSDGRTADVVLTVRCAGFDPASIRVTLQQGGVAGAASSGTDYRCGAQRRVVVPVSASTGTFHKGSAEASATATFHSDGNSRSGSSSRSIQLT